MKRLKVGFSDKSKNSSIEWYDLREDWVLIETSLAKQYGIRIRSETDMPWLEFCTLVGGLMADTPLGQVVGIRSESDPEVLKEYTTDQTRMYDEWRNKQAIRQLDNEEKLDKDMEALSNMLAGMFGGGGVK